MDWLALPIGAFIAAAAAFHVYWGLGGQIGWRVAVPQREDGTPLFMPSRLVTLLVAMILIAILGVLGAYVLHWDWPVPRAILRWVMAVLALVFLARGLSWHPYVGLLKRIRNTAFARNDTRFYSPGCVLTGLGFLALAWQG